MYVQTGAMHENPHGVPHDEIRRMIEELPPEMAAQVCFGKYVDLSGLVFTAELVNQMFDRSLPRVRGERFLDEKLARQNIEWQQGNGRPEWNRFATGIDLARKKDYTVITVLDTMILPARVVYWRRTNRVPWDTIYAEIGLAQFLFPGEFLIDETGIGDVVKEALENRMYCPTHNITFEASGSCPGGNGRACNEEITFRLTPNGYIKTTASKVQLVNHLQACMSHGYDPDRPGEPFGLIRSPVIQAMEDEFPQYAWDDKKLQTDTVMSLGLAAWQGLEQRVEDPIFGSPYGGF
jgi:hypothetical protein